MGVTYSENGGENESIKACLYCIYAFACTTKTAERDIHRSMIWTVKRANRI